MVWVQLKGIFDNAAEFIGVFFEPDPQIETAIRKIAGCKWCNSNKCWLIPLGLEQYKSIKKRLHGIAVIDSKPLKDYLLKKRKKAPAADNPELNTKPPAVSDIGSRTDAVVIKDRTAGIAACNQHVLPAIEQELRLKSYSRSTIRTYLNEVAPLLRILKTKCADDLTVDEIRRYLVYCHETLKLSENTLHSRINALKFYYEQVLKRERFFWDIPRPKKHLQIPRLLNEEELARLFNAVGNKKHKAMLFTAYSAGLRVSELAALILSDIDSRRMQIFVEKAKGKKDRYVNLSPVLLDILREYVKTYVPRPRFFLFESEQTGTAFPARTVQQIFSNAKARAHINKKVGIHSLRHSFATHLLDKGTDIAYIKDLLGHFNIKTTERYLHVSKRKLVNIESPFDDLWKAGGIDW